MAVREPHSHDAEGALVIVERAAVELEANGHTEAAEQVRVVMRTQTSETVSVDDAATLAGVSPATIKNWIGRGVVISRQAAPGARHRIDRASLLATIQRRADVEAAKAAFASPQTAVQHLTGLDAETIARLGGV